MFGLMVGTTTLSMLGLFGLLGFLPGVVAMAVGGPQVAFLAASILIVASVGL